MEQIRDFMKKIEDAWGFSRTNHHSLNGFYLGILSHDSLAKDHRQDMDDRGLCGFMGDIYFSHLHIFVVAYSSTP
jgi:hypothetical protein